MSGLTGSSSFYGFDQSGNTRLLTDASATVTDSYTYTAFGTEVARTGSTPNPHRFGGEVGYYRDWPYRQYVRARQLDTVVGRWLSPDPEADDLNLYRYVFSDPVNESDPSGLQRDHREKRRRHKHPYKSHPHHSSGAGPDYGPVFPEAKKALDELRRDMPGWHVTQAFRHPGTNSGLTHDIQHGKGNAGGSVAFDLRARDHTSSEILRMLQALPKHGFIGWYRHWFTRRKAPNFHIHIVYAFAALQHSSRRGHPGSGRPGHFAGDQVDQWLRRRNGLTSNLPYFYCGRDNKDKPIFPWTDKQIEYVRQGHEKANPVDK